MTPVLHCKWHLHIVEPVCNVNARAVHSYVLCGIFMNGLTAFVLGNGPLIFQYLLTAYVIFYINSILNVNISGTNNFNK